MANPTEAQLAAALEVLRGALGATQIIGAYLFGSAVAGGLRPVRDLADRIVREVRASAF